MYIHASCVAIEGKAVLLTGESGIGKTDVALRLIEAGAQLVADDQTWLQRKDGLLVASAAPNIQGMIEIRHVGLVKVPFVVDCPVALYIALTRLDETLDRLPEVPPVFLLDQSVQQLRLPAMAASTPAKIRAALVYTTLL